MKPFIVSGAVLTAVLLSDQPAASQASGNAGHPGSEGCWCGFQTQIPRPYVVKGSGSAADKQAAADMLDEWNRFVRLFTVQIDGSSSLGGSGNGINELNVFISSQEASAIYGFTMEPGLFGRAVNLPDAAFGEFNQCKTFDPAGCGPFGETDVVINAGFSTGWTNDWNVPGNDQRGGKAQIQATVLHEVGHTLGLHHVFDLEANAGFGNSFSTMNYANDDAGRYVTRIDSKTLRTAYPGAARTLTDVAIFPLVYGNDQYAQQYSAPSTTSVQAGEGFTVDKFLVQNVGSQPASSIVVTFYLIPRGSRQYPQPTDVKVGTVSIPSADVDAEGVFENSPLSVPAGTASGEYFLGAIVTVGGNEDSAFTPGKPGNNRFIVGHDPRAVIRVIGAAGQSFTADFAFSPASPVAGQTVVFEDKSRGGAAAWQWSFGDAASGGANVSTAQNPQHAFTAAGTYTVTLTARTASGTSSTSTQSVVVTASPGSGTSSVTVVVPIVLEIPGRFSSELTLTNSGASTASVALQYRSASVFGGAGTGTVNETLAPGRQLVIPNAIAYLRNNGLGIPTGSNQGGALFVRFDGLLVASAGSASARTTAPSGNGSAGLSYPAVPVGEAFDEAVLISGLRESAADRSNLALVNAGLGGPIQIRITVVKDDGTAVAFDPVTLGPGEWNQYNQILQSAGFGASSGFALVERVSGSERFLAYGVFNDNVTSDGSYVPATPISKVDALLGVPVVVETSTFKSELVLTNPTAHSVQAYIEYIESLAAPGVSTGLFYVDLDPFETAILPGIIDQLRQAGASIGPRGANYAGAVGVLFAENDSLSPGLAGARTASPAPGGGFYGLFYLGDSLERSARDAYIYGLQQNSTTRSNIAIVNVGVTNAPITVRMEVYDGATGALVRRETLPPLAASQWTQINAVLGGTQNGYVRLTVLGAEGAFQAYGVLNDGATSSSGTSDGSYVPMTLIQ